MTFPSPLNAVRRWKKSFFRHYFELISLKLSRNREFTFRNNPLLLAQDLSGEYSEQDDHQHAAIS